MRIFPGSRESGFLFFYNNGMIELYSNLSLTYPFLIFNCHLSPFGRSAEGVTF